MDEAAHCPRPAERSTHAARGWKVHRECYKLSTLLTESALRLSVEEPPSEPTLLRFSRAASRLLPKGRSVIVQSVARIAGYGGPFFANVGRDRFLIDLQERVSRTLYLYGAFEPTIAALVPRLVSAGETVIDAGANFGYFSILCARAVTRTGRVFAFDPDPRNIVRLLANIRANEVPNVEHVACGLFDRCGQIAFNLASDIEDNLGSSSIIKGGAGRRQIEVPITTLDEFATVRKIERFHFVKMDIEGAEVEAVAGAEMLLSKRRIGRVLVEMHNRIIGRARAALVAQRFVDAGYRGYHIREERRVPHTLGAFLQPLTGSSWLDMANPHCLFTVEPVPEVD